MTKRSKFYVNFNNFCIGKKIYKLKHKVIQYQSNKVIDQ